MARRPFTPNEDKMIIAAIKANAVNLQEAFETVAAQTNRTPAVVSRRYYGNLRKQEVFFALVAGTVVQFPNVKNKVRRKPKVA